MGRRTAMKLVATVPERHIDSTTAEAICDDLKRRFPELANLRPPNNKPFDSPSDELYFLLINFTSAKTSVGKRDIIAIAEIFHRYSETEISDDIITGLDYRAMRCFGNKKPKKSSGRSKKSKPQARNQNQQQNDSSSGEEIVVAQVAGPHTRAAPRTEAQTNLQKRPTSINRKLPRPDAFMPSGYYDDVLGPNWTMFASLEVLPNGDIEKQEAIIAVKASPAAVSSGLSASSDNSDSSFTSSDDEDEDDDDVEVKQATPALVRPVLLAINGKASSPLANNNNNILDLDDFGYGVQQAYPVQSPQMQDAAAAQRASRLVELAELMDFGDQAVVVDQEFREVAASPPAIMGHSQADRELTRTASFSTTSSSASSSPFTDSDDESSSDEAEQSSESSSSNNDSDSASEEDEGDAR